LGAPSSTSAGTDEGRVGSGTLALADTVPVTGTVNAPDNTIISNLHASEPTSLSDPSSLIPDPGVPGQLAGWGGDPSQLNDRRAPQQGIAPDLAARTGTEPSLTRNSL